MDIKRDITSLDVECGAGAAEGPVGQPPARAASITLTWRALSYSVPGRRRHGGRVPLLSNLTGCLLPGQFMAVLGPSGCGKTTLLDCWGGRKTLGSLEGQVLFNGQPPTPALLRRHELKHPRSMPRADKVQRVEALVDQLGLSTCAHTTIGSVLRRGISGGEAKRCNIGIALVTSPKVLFIDELTSGLDSFYGGEVALVVQDLVRRHSIATAASIHSPSPTTFALFDSILLLQRGAAVYFGPNGAGTPREGLADFLVDVTTRAPGDPEIQQAFAAAYAASPLAAENARRVEAVFTSLAQQAGGADGGQGSQTVGGASAGACCFLPCCGEASQCSRGASSCVGLCRGEEAGTGTPLWWALLVLYRYRTLRAIKRAGFIMPRTGDKIMITFLIATIYWGIGDSQALADVSATAAVLFLWSTLTAFTSMGILPCLIVERPVFLRERADGLYRPITYLVYKVTEEVAVGTLPAVAYSALVFYLVRLQGSFLLFFLIYYVSMCVAISLSLLAGAISPTVDVAGAVLPAYATTLMFFSGFVIPWSQLPSYWRWYATINHIRYALGAMLINQFEGERNVAYQGGQQVLQFYGLAGANKWLWLLFESLFFWVFSTACWAALAFMRHQRR
ncbi:P-loop containing nucleoside triphosphate hydrolase isoform B [Micractinium conductrix]|uniref:P-loop containing nucleoside triphosphate hydrolase isoform B n=1 Tax=Micractinium conductrix TaxID=554055 RepID=A0A2P6VF83_9CHLO|nr:P-loop containing nucleoside triphosphate hydrolase isoform B [Micractinium conductrix]|eukprot:PSC72752.1 P-loop containing nucleoside triphosphate hydrolase isoform B [Micractinium conductrix]